MIQTEIEQAVAFYKQGYTCTQSILASFAARYDLQQNLAFRIGEPFGAKTSCSGDMCGSVTGAIMVLGLQYGSILSNDDVVRLMDELVSPVKVTLATNTLQETSPGEI